MLFRDIMLRKERMNFLFFVFDATIHNVWRQRKAHRKKILISVISNGKEKNLDFISLV